MIEGSGSGFIPLTNGTGSGSRGPKDIHIRRTWIRIRNSSCGLIYMSNIIPCSGQGTTWWRRSTTAGRAATCPAAQRTARPPPWRAPSPSTPTPWRSCTSPRRPQRHPAEDFSTTHIRLSLQKKAAAHPLFFVCCTKCNTAANSTYTLNAIDLVTGGKKSWQACFTRM